MLGNCSLYNATFMSVAPNQNNAIDGLKLHTDGVIQGTLEYIGCLWAPLHPCGVDAPGLAVVRANREKVTDYLRRHYPGKEIPGWHSPTHWGETDAFKVETIRAELGEDALWTPAMEPGDVMAFTNWTIHGSHVTPSMKERRSAAIMRFKQIKPPAPNS
jgi:hypothetical protein